MYKHHSNLNHNTFYGDHKESSVTLLFNDQPGTVKSFSTLNYEGSQARNKANLTDGEYHNLVERDGWYVSDIKTNLQESSYLEFTGKEDKWFTYIKGDTTTLQNLDEKEFSVQGVGSYLSMNVVGAEAKQEVCLTITPNINCNPILGCTDPNANNYNANANIDDGSCVYPEPVYGCTDPVASNYNPSATVDDGSCEQCEISPTAGTSLQQLSWSNQDYPWNNRNTLVSLNTGTGAHFHGAPAGFISTTHPFLIPITFTNQGNGMGPWTVEAMSSTAAAWNNADAHISVANPATMVDFVVGTPYVANIVQTNYGGPIQIEIAQPGTYAIKITSSLGCVWESEIIIPAILPEVRASLPLWENPNLGGIIPNPHVPPIDHNH